MSSLTLNSNSVASAASSTGAAASMINRRSFDPNKPTSLYLPINYDDELGNNLLNFYFLFYLFIYCLID